MQGIPYRSKLRPHFELIRSERLKKKTWREISELLKTHHGILSTPSNIYEFFKRNIDRRKPLGFPDELSPTENASETQPQENSEKNEEQWSKFLDQLKEQEAAKIQLGSTPIPPS